MVHRATVVGKFPVLLGRTRMSDVQSPLYRDRFSQTGMYEARPYGGARNMLANLNQPGFDVFWLPQNRRFLPKESSSISTSTRLLTEFSAPNSTEGVATRPN